MKVPLEKLWKAGVVEYVIVKCAVKTVSGVSVVKKGSY